MSSTLALLLGAAALANAHGYFVTPVGRQPGDAFKAACGEQANYMMSGDINGNIQGLRQLTANQADFNAAECNLWQCKGMKFEDNTAQVQSYTSGQDIDMYFAIRAPHDGYANVSVVDTATNSVLASLKQWDEYALTSRPTVESEMNFTVTMPTTLGDKCSTAGDCVIQMHWNAESIDQTYQSCIDFTLGGGGGNETTGGNATTKRDLGEREHARRWF